MTAGNPMHDAFARAYKDGRWHHGSGSGSSPANTAAYRVFLAAYLRDHEIRTVLDIGCGDWRFSQLINWHVVRYTGIDVVPDLVDANTARFGRPGWIDFACADALAGWTLPAAELILCKDLLQHWPDAAVHELGGRLEGRRALLTYDLGDRHADTEPGGHRPLDLTGPPFSWPVREVLRYESVSHEGRVRRTKVVVELAP
jgi:SAM-dependent methyltransferase